MSETQQENAVEQENPAGANTDFGSDMEMLLDISVNLAVEMGSKNIKLKDLLKLSKNSVIELEKLAGDPLEIKVNGALIAHGEVVVVNGRYGIKLTEVVSKSERIKNIQD